MNKIENKEVSKRFTHRCEECGSISIQHEGSCYICLNCGFSPCK